MIFHSSLSDGKSPQDSWNLLSILAVLSNVVVWMVSTSPTISKSSSPFSNPLVTALNVPITSGIIVTGMSHSCFNSRARSSYLSFFSHFFRFILWSVGTANSTILQFLFSLCWLILGLVFWPRLGDPCVCQSLFFLLTLLSFLFHISVSNKVSLSLPETFQYSSWSKQCYNLDYLHLSSYFQVI